MADFTVVRQPPAPEVREGAQDFYRCLLSFRHPKSGKSFGFLMVSAHQPFGTFILNRVFVPVNRQKIKIP
jgi:hypothetical protein